MIEKFRWIFRLPDRKKRILLIAIIRTSTAWVMIKVLPYSVWRGRLGHQVPLSEDLFCAGTTIVSDNNELENIVWAHSVLARRAKSVFTCLMIGFSARAMLQTRGYDSLLVLGVDRSGEVNQKRLGAHAWVIHKGVIFSGGDGHEKFVPVAAFGWNTATHNVQRT